MVRLRDALPPVYSSFLDPFFDRERPSERRATCESCAMCDHGQPAPVQMEYFRPDTKCCTFFPILPNYLVGAILSDPAMEEGKRRIRDRIKARVGVWPFHIGRPGKLSLILQHYANGFGRARSLQCPYFDENNLAASCTIWRHREAICQTYYCKYEGGQRGFDFWTALKDYLGLAQHHLSRHAAFAIDGSVSNPIPDTNLTLEDIEDLPPREDHYASWWKSWVGREEELYVKCFEWVKERSHEQFVKNIGSLPDVVKAFEKLQAAHDRLENKILPARLIRNEGMKKTHVGEKVVVTTYHRFDSFALDQDLYEVVGRFKPELTLEENLRSLAADGIEIVPELIEYLVMAGVLIEPKTG